MAVQRGKRAIERIQVTHQVLHAPVEGIGKKVPVERVVVPPFPFCGKLTAHEEKFLARMRPT